MSKVELTPIEKIQVAYGHFIDGIEQDKLSRLFAINIGRVNEACKDIGAAAGLTTPSYKSKRRAKQTKTEEK